MILNITLQIKLKSKFAHSRKFYYGEIRIKHTEHGIKVKTISSELRHILIMMTHRIAANVAMEPKCMYKYDK